MLDIEPLDLKTTATIIHNDVTKNSRGYRVITKDRTAMHTNLNFQFITVLQYLNIRYYFKVVQSLFMSKIFL